MFMHNKRLQYTVHVSEPNPVLGSFMLEQFGGPDGELAAAMRYFTQGLGEDDPGRKDMLLDIATEELSHLEVIGSIVAMLNKGAKAQISEGSMKEAELYMSLTEGGNSHTQSILYGGGPALTNSSGVHGPPPISTAVAIPLAICARTLQLKAEPRLCTSD